ncbi:MAG: extracellular solute-binding protein [Candidatus Eisenbacteria bacterium]|nr:extracellular solute-binding protein [Candidatus Latescibacterota bacterium]MBD3303102.1 extracellular solute-binding protein [Candidatus Eisenbacteria bacterium]
MRRPASSAARGAARGLLAVLLALALVGCAEEPEGIRLRFLDRPDEGGAWAEILSRFEERHPEIDVELVEGPTSTDTREGMYATTFLSGEATYDIVYMDVIWVPRFADRGWLLPLDDRFPEAEREAFLPGDVAGSVFEGSVYRVPLRADAGVLFYRSDLIEEPPETFAELVRLCERHQDPPDRHGFLFQGQQYEGLVCSFLEVLWGHGGRVLDRDGRVVLDGPEGHAALDWLVDLVGRVTPEAVTTYQEEESRHVFHEGRALFLRNWPYVWSKAQAADSPVRGKVGIAPMVHAPGGESSAALGGWGFGIASSCPHPDAAWRFIEFATSAEAMRILNERNGAIPARRALYRDPELLRRHPHYSQLYEVLLRSRPRPVHPRYAEISDAIQMHVSAALVGEETPDEAIERAGDQIRGILDR